jgi:uncharacterized coiled-coil DUF342 family protein
MEEEIRELRRDLEESRERVETLERSVAEISLKNEELEKLVRGLQNSYHLLQRGLKILLSESTPKGGSEPPPHPKPPPPPAPPSKKPAIQDL